MKSLISDDNFALFFFGYNKHNKQIIIYNNK